MVLSSPCRVLDIVCWDTVGAEQMGVVPAVGCDEDLVLIKGE